MVRHRFYDDENFFVPPPLSRRTIELFVAEESCCWNQFQPFYMDLNELWDFVLRVIHQNKAFIRGGYQCGETFSGILFWRTTVS